MQLPKKYRNVKRNLKVKRGISGLGLYTLDPIEKRGFVIEYVGEILNLKQADERGGKYLFETSANRYIDGTNRKNIARYINHSCIPNCEVDIKRGRVYVFARRNIKAGEELNYDYEEEYFNEHIKPYGCRCEKCKKTA
jgi:SET domain-containing protein